MDEFRVIQIVIDDKDVYIRRERVGASSIGGDDVIPYQLSVMKAHSRSGQTPVDIAMNVANTIVVTILCNLSGTKEQADAVKAYELTLARKNRLYQVLNQR